MLPTKNPLKTAMLAWYMGVSLKRLAMSRKITLIVLTSNPQPPLPLSLRLLHNLRMPVNVEFLPHLE